VILTHEGDKAAYLFESMCIRLGEGDETT
jgi:hypothetical protein